MAWDQINLQKKLNSTKLNLPKVQTLKRVVAGHVQFQDFIISVPTFNHQGSITYKGMELFTQFPKVVSGDRPQTTMGLNRDGCRKFQEFVESGFRKGLTS